MQEEENNKSKKLLNQKKERGKSMKPKASSLKRSIKLITFQQNWQRKKKTKITNISNERGAITTEETLRR